MPERDSLDPDPDGAPVTEEQFHILSRRNRELVGRRRLGIITAEEIAELESLTLRIDAYMVGIRVIIEGIFSEMGATRPYDITKPEDRRELGEKMRAWRASTQRTDKGGFPIPPQPNRKRLV